MSGEVPQERKSIMGMVSLAFHCPMIQLAIKLRISFLVLGKACHFVSMPFEVYEADMNMNIAAFCH